MYSKTHWQDRVVDPETGEVVQEGTFMSAEHFNNMEDGIEANDTAISEISESVETIETTLDTGVGTTITLTVNSSTFVMKLALKNSEGNILSESEVDLPIESMIVNAEYVEATKSLVLTLQSGSKVTVPFSALINGLVNDSRKVNNITLESDVVLDGNDIKATGYAKAESKSNITGTDTINQALGKLELKSDTNETNISTLKKHMVGELTDSDFSEDSTSVMVKTVPTGMSNYAAIKVIGGYTRKTVNLCNVSDSVSISANGNIIALTDCLLKSGVSYVMTGKFSNADVSADLIDDTGVKQASIPKTSGAFTINFTAKNDCSKVRLYVGGITTDTTLTNFMIQEGTTATPYEPYGQLWNAPIESVVSTSADGTTETTLLMPDAIKSLPDWGCAVSDTVYNCYDAENKIYHHACNFILDLGSYTWVKLSDGKFYANIDTLGTPKSNGYVGICSKYEVYNGTYDSIPDKSIMISNSNFSATKRILIYDSNYTDVDTFKASLSNVSVVYERESKELIDISDMLHPIRVETGGTITFNNEHSLDVPNTITYKKEVSLNG